MSKYIYIKGRFLAYYTGLISGENTRLSRIYKDIVFIDKRLLEAEETEAYEERFLTMEPYFVAGKMTDLHISWKGERTDVFFLEDLEYVVMNHIAILRPSSNNTPGVLEADFYGTLEVKIPLPIVQNIKPQKSRDKNHDGPDDNKETNPPSEEEIDPVFKKPWEPDDFLKNFGIKSDSWSDWKLRWSKASIEMAFLLFVISLFVAFGWLSFPIMWLPFLYLLKRLGDLLLVTIAPKYNKSYLLASSNTIGGGRKIIRFIYSLILLLSFLLLLYSKLYILAAVAGVLFFLSLFTYSSPLLFSVRRLFQALAFILFIFAMFRLSQYIKVPMPAPKPDDDNEELIPDKQDSLNNLNQYTLSWNDYKNNSYKGSYGISNTNFKYSYANRTAQQPVNGRIEEVYLGVYQKDKNLLNSLYKMFDKIKTEKNLDQKSFAEMAGCFVQRIPYVLVHELSCEQLVRQQYNDAFIQQYHREGKQCLQNCKFGLQAPAEFAYNLKGDCDTRALLMFVIMDHYKYDVAILTSEVYGHAILGLGLPYNGLHKSCNGVQYYTWELTAKDWQPGLLSPEISNMSNWNIALVNK